MRISDWSSDVCSSDLELRTIAASTSADGLAPEFPPLLARLGQIPNVAEYAVRGSVDYVAPVGEQDFRLNGWAPYVGSSRLGLGPILGERKSVVSGKGVSGRLDSGGRRVHKKKKKR